jgi:hypothetical protein
MPARQKLGASRMSPQPHKGLGINTWGGCERERATTPDQTKSTDAAARDEILQCRPDLKGKSLEAMRRILRREA